MVMEEATHHVCLCAQSQKGISLNFCAVGEHSSHHRGVLIKVNKLKCFCSPNEAWFLKNSIPQFLIECRRCNSERFV